MKNLLRYLLGGAAPVSPGTGIFHCCDEKRITWEFRRSSLYRLKWDRWRPKNWDMVVEGLRSRAGKTRTRKVDGNLSSGLEIITNVLRSNDSFIPIKYRPIRINTEFFWLRVTRCLEKGWHLVNRIFFYFPFAPSRLCFLSRTQNRAFARKNSFSPEIKPEIYRLPCETRPRPNRLLSYDHSKSSVKRWNRSLSSLTSQ